MLRTPLNRQVQTVALLGIQIIAGILHSQVDLQVFRQFQGFIQNDLPPRIRP